MPAIVPLVIGAAATVGGMVQSNQAAKKAAGAGNASKVDIAALDEQTRQIAKQNAYDSAELERLLTPEVPQLRTEANQAVRSGIGGTSEQRAASAMMFDRLNNPQGMSSASFAMSPLLQQAIAKAREDLALGGRLSLSQRNEAIRAGGAQSGTVSGGMGLGRDLAARDLGLSSFSVEQQRLQNAANLGSAEQGALGNQATFNLNRDSLNAQNWLNNYGAFNTYLNNLRSQDLQAAAFGQSITPPVVGLDPSAVANLSVANSNINAQALMNAANIKAQGAQNLTKFGGQMIGYGMGGMGGG